MSLRAPRTAIMQKPAALLPDVVVMRLTPTVGVQQAAQLTARAYEGVDMSLLPAEESFLSLLQSHLSEGTYIGMLRSELEASASVQADESLTAFLAQGGSGVVEDAAHVPALLKAIEGEEVSSYAGVSMWNGSTVSNWKVVRVVFKKETWLSSWFQCALAGCACGTLGLWGWRLASQVSELLATTASSAADGGAGVGATPAWGLLGSLGFALEALAFGAVAFAAYKAANLIAFILSRNSLKLRARAHAPFRHGAAGLQCMRGAVAAAQLQARSMGYGMWILNVDAEHPDSDALPRAGFRTDFLQKWLVEPPAAAGVAASVGDSGAAAAGETTALKAEDSEAGARWALMAPAAYCDPRGV
jgi:hypothetical protein